MGARHGPVARVALVLVLVFGGAGCNWGRDAGGSANTGVEDDTPEIPSDVESFLAELAPLPGDAKAVKIDYTVTGPALRGELHTTLGPGGQRRDRWELRSTAGDSFLTTSGTSIVNTTQLWIGSDGEPGELRPNALVDLAKAYLGRDADARAKIVASIRAWHETLAEQRERVGGELDTVAGTQCLRTRIAAQNVCMWEAANVMLAYEGAAFTIEATAIDTGAELEPKTFELPPLSIRAEKLESETKQDYEAILDELAAGSHAKVAQLLYANLALPSMSVPKG